jgi:membrane-associated phospholipid phosphatase
MVLSLLLMYARIYLRAHDPLQVIAGFLFGLGMTFIPNMIISYVV